MKQRRSIPRQGASRRRFHRTGKYVHRLNYIVANRGGIRF